MGAGDEFRTDRYTLDGTLEMRFRRVFQRRRVTSADVEALRQRELDAVRSDAGRRRIERRYRDHPHAEEMPAHGGRMLVDLQHNLWVEEYMGPRDSIPRYTVFAGDGDFLGDVAMPARFEPRHIGSDYVLGVWRDADDVEHVQLYDLIKPESCLEDSGPAVIGALVHERIGGRISAGPGHRSCDDRHRLRGTELQHPVKDHAPHQRFHPLALSAAGQQLRTHDSFESPDAVLRPHLLMLPRFASPLSESATSHRWIASPSKNVARMLMRGKHGLARDSCTNALGRQEREC